MTKLLIRDAQGHEVELPVVDTIGELQRFATVQARSDDGQVYDLPLPDDVPVWLSRGMSKHSMTLAEVAELAGVTRQAAFNWTHGRNRPPLAVLMKLTQIFTQPQAAVSADPEVVAKGRVLKGSKHHDDALDAVDALFSKHVNSPASEQIKALPKAVKAKPKPVAAAVKAPEVVRTVLRRRHFAPATT